MRAILLALLVLPAFAAQPAQATIFHQCVDPQDEVVLWACVTVEGVTDTCVEGQIGKRPIDQCVQPTVPPLP